MYDDELKKAGESSFTTSQIAKHQQDRPLDPAFRGFGRAVALTGDTGDFWFFTPDNIEVVVKALNGCGENSRYWVFGAGLTNINVVTTVTDTQTGATKTYVNPQGKAFLPIQDTDAFSTCP